MKAIIVVYFLAVAAAAVGWGLNFYKLILLIATPGAGIDLWFVGRAVGLFFAPLGVVLGYAV